MFGRLLLAAALLVRRLARLLPRPGPRSWRPSRSWATWCAEVGGERDRPRRPGRRRHRRPHLPAQAERRAHACRARRRMVSNGLGFEGLDRPSGRGGALQGPRHRGDGRRADPAKRRRHGYSQPRPRSALLAGRRPARAATSPTSPTAWPTADPANAAHYRERAQPYDQRLAAARSMDQGGDRQGAARPAQGDHRPRLVPLLRRAPTACSSRRRAATAPTASRRPATWRR